MLNATTLDIMELGGQGYCCSQILVLLAMRNAGLECAPLVRAMSGLCNGFGDCSGACGVLTGGLSVLGLYAGKGSIDQQADYTEQIPLLLESYRDWFTDVTSEYGDITCEAIMDGNCGTVDPIKCGGLLTAAHEKLIQILQDNNIDISELEE
ncbi:MAG: C-GCAxxG-C-C family protein [Pseudomonadota bacterium]